jgi:Calcineurin-like phosphoesterase.
MHKIIPLHSLVIAVGPNNETRENLIREVFPEHEIISAPSMCERLVGHQRMTALGGHLFAEMRRFAELKLKLGSRVIFDAPNLKKSDRLALAKMGERFGVPVFYLICDPTGAPSFAIDAFEATQADLRKGDGVAEIIDTRIDTFVPILPRPSLEQIFSRWSGITVIGDVHGKMQGLLAALSWARRRNHYIVFLGDVIDYGRDTLAVADEVYRVVTRGEGEIILGNHERKIMRWIEQRDSGVVRIRIGEGNRVTIQALQELGAIARSQWEGRFRGLVMLSEPIRRIGNVVFSHAAVHPDYWKGQTGVEIERWATLGNYIQDEKGNPQPSTEWVDAIPEGMVSFVGHQCVGDHPISIKGRRGGQAVFLDTGSGKGGNLSSADLKLTEDGAMRVINYNRH